MAQPEFNYRYKGHTVIWNVDEKGHEGPHQSGKFYWKERENGYLS